MYKFATSTHLFLHFFIFQSDKIKCHTMSVLRPDKNCTDVEDIVFLYRYTSVLVSFSLFVAQ